MQPRPPKVGSSENEDGEDDDGEDDDVLRMPDVANVGKCNTVNVI